MCCVIRWVVPCSTIRKSRMCHNFIPIKNYRKRYHAFVKCMLDFGVLWFTCINSKLNGASFSLIEYRNYFTVAKKQNKKKHYDKLSTVSMISNGVVINVRSMRRCALISSLSNFPFFFHYLCFWFWLWF